MRLIGVIAAAIATTAVAAPAASAAPSGALYVQQAAAGSLRKVDGAWRLTLSRPAGRVTTFQDRPARSGGSVGLARFVAGWPASFGDDPPNAALEIAGAPSGRDVALLELGRPRLDRERDQIVYRVKRLRTSPGSALETFGRRADPGVSGSFGRASLFIDDGGPDNVLTVSFSQIPSGTGFDLALDKPAAYIYGPAASWVSETADIDWGGSQQELSVGCGATTCQGTATITVDAPTDQPLTGVIDMPPSGSVSAAWAGGATVTFPLDGGGGPYSLPPG